MGMPSLGDSLRRSPQAATTRHGAINLFGLRLAPRILDREFLVRILFLRIFLILLYAAGLDSLWTRAALQAATASSSWQARLGLLGVLLPLAFNSVGLLWPLLSLKTFERHYASFHKALVYCCIACKVLEELSQLSISYGTCRQTMLLLGLLFIVHQDPHYIRPLSAMLVAFSVCHAATLMERVRQSLPGPGTGYTTNTSSSSSSTSGPSPAWPIEVSVAGEYLVVSYMIILGLHQLCQHYAPLREQLPQGATPGLARAWRRASVPSACGMHSRISSRSTGSGGGGLPSAAAVPPQPLNKLYTTKLAAVKFCNGVFAVAAAWRQYQLAMSSTVDGDSSSIFGPAHTTHMAIACGVGGVLLVLHSLVALLSPSWFQRFDQVVNSLSLLVCLTTKGLMAATHVYSQAASSPQGLDPGTGASIAFHTFVVMLPSLAVHEHALPWFRLQLLGLALFWCHGHTLMRLSMTTQGWFSPTAAALLSSSGLELLSYAPLMLGALATYSWVCVGRHVVCPQPSSSKEVSGTAFPWYFPVGRVSTELPDLGGHSSASSSRSSPQTSMGGAQEAARFGNPSKEWGTAAANVEPWEGWRSSQPGDLLEQADVVWVPQVTTPLGPPPMTRRFRGSTGGIATLLDVPAFSIQADRSSNTQSRPSGTSEDANRSSGGGGSSNSSSRVQTPPPHVPGRRARRNSNLRSTSFPANGDKQDAALPPVPTPAPRAMPTASKAYRRASETVGPRMTPNRAAALHSSTGGAPSRAAALYGSTGGASSGVRSWRSSVTDGSMAVANAFAATVAAKVSTWQAAHWSSRGVSLTGEEGAPEEAQEQVVLEPQDVHKASDAAVALCCIVMWMPAVWGGAKGVLWPATELSAPLRALGAMGVALYTGLATWNLAVRLWWPQLLKKVPRDHMWSLHVTLLTVVTFITETLLGLTSRVSIRMVLSVRNALLGLLDVPAPSMFAWLPMLVLLCLLKQAWDARAPLTASLLAAEALEYNVSPLISFTLMKMTTQVLRTAAASAVVALVPRFCTKDSAPGWRRRCLMAVPVVTQGSLAALLVCIKLLGPPDVPAVLNPFSVLPLLKRGVLRAVDRWCLDAATQADTVQTMWAVGGMCLCFLALSALQAYVLNNSAQGSARHAWYEEHKAQVVALPQQAVARLAAHKDSQSAPELRALVISMVSELATTSFPGCSLMLMLLEDASLDSGIVTCHVVQAAPDAPDLHRQQQQMPLELLPTVELACRRGQMLARTALGAGLHGCDDLQVLAETYGCNSFLVVPLACAGQDQGALLLTAKSPVSLDTYVTRLAKDLGAALAHTLYTVSCVSELQANKHIIQDIMPEKVARQVKRSVTRRMLANNNATAGSNTARSSGAGGGASPASPKTAAAAACETDTPPLTTHNSAVEAGPEQEDSTSSSSAVELPVIYKQWHPEVSVLFADISNYTAMSQQVEPEQVMMLLHELFSKYDNLCTQYGVYKVETIGDCYMACTGLLTEDPQHATHLVQFGQRMLAAAASVPHPQGGTVRIRVGIHSGRVMSGIVGSIRSRYCLFGDTVNTASRMESTGKVDCIQVSEDTYQLLGDLQAAFEAREAVAVKGKGTMNTYVLKEEVAQQLLQEGGGGTRHGGYW